MSLFRSSHKSNTLDKAANVHRSSSKQHNMDRSKISISGPVKLLSTTNMLSYTAPPVPRHRTPTHSVSSASSNDGSPVLDRGLPPPSPPTSPEPSIDEQFRAPKKSLHKAKSASQISGRSYEEAPPLPDISTLRSHRSMKRLHTPPPSADSSRMPSLDFGDSSPVPPLPLDTSPSRWSVKKKASLDISRMSNSTTSSWGTRKPTYEEQAHPFGAELAQVDEIAEDFGVSAEVREEEALMKRRGLMRFKAEDYTRDIEAIFSSFFGFTARTVRAQSAWQEPRRPNPPAAMPMWI